MRLIQFCLFVLWGISVCGCSLRGFYSPFKRTEPTPLPSEETASYFPQQLEGEMEQLEPIRMDEPIKITAPDTSQGWPSNSRS